MKCRFCENKASVSLVTYDALASKPMDQYPLCGDCYAEVNKVGLAEFISTHVQREEMVEPAVEPVTLKVREAGFFWASSGSCQWYNLIVEVHGTAPFYRMRAWERKEDRMIQDLKLHDIKHWGPRIVEPEMPKPATT